MANFDSNYTPQPVAPEPKKNNMGMIITIVVIVLCCCCLVGAAGGWWLWQNGDKFLGTGGSTLLRLLSVA